MDLQRTNGRGNGQIQWWNYLRQAQPGRGLRGAEDVVEGHRFGRGWKEAVLSREKNEDRIHLHRADAIVQQVDQAFAAFVENVSHVYGHNLRP